jgi:ferredoxin
MAYMITDDCISCGACEAECKNEAIKEGETEAAKCTECVGWFDKPKCAEVCPVDCCLPDPAQKESKDQLLEKWKKLHPGKTPQ